jgi:HAD superfamily hydrolase (TIGR01484 family)
MQNKFQTHLYLDFDGTITNLADQINSQTLYLLRRLQGKCLRVIATGRTVSSFRQRVSDDFPIDYLIFSTGAGIMDWQKKEIIKCYSFSQTETEEITGLLQKLKFSFSRHHPIPHNHQFEYFPGEHNVQDFQRYLQLHGKDKISDLAKVATSTQFLIITDDQNYPMARFRQLEKFANIFKLSSPIDHKTTWIEILPKDVSKSRAANNLIKLRDDQPEITIAVGNDFNDTDLIEWADRGYVVSTANIELVARYKSLENGKNQAVALLLKSILDSFDR